MQKKSDDSDTTKSVLSRYRLVQHRRLHSRVDNFTSVTVKNRDPFDIKEKMKMSNDSIGELKNEIISSGTSAQKVANTANLFAYIVYLVTISSLAISWASLKNDALIVGLQNNSISIMGEINCNINFAEWIVLIVMIAASMMLVCHVSEKARRFCSKIKIGLISRLPNCIKNRISEPPKSP